MAPFMHGVHAVIGGLSILLAALPAHAGNLLKDPGFELPAAPVGSYTVYQPGSKIGPWTVTGGGNVSLASGSFSQSGFTFNTYSGLSEIDLTGLCDCYANSGLAQMVKTIPGRKYKITYQVGNAYNFFNQSNTSATVLVYANGVEIGSGTNNSSTGILHAVWKKFSVTYTATAATAIITFVNDTSSGPYFTGLDGVSMVLQPL